MATPHRARRVIPDPQDDSSEDMAEKDRSDEEHGDGEVTEEDGNGPHSPIQVPHSKKKRPTQAVPTDPQYAARHLSQLLYSVGDTSDLPSSLEESKAALDQQDMNNAAAQKRFVEASEEYADLEERLSTLHILKTASKDAKCGPRRAGNYVTPKKFRTCESRPGSLRSRKQRRKGH